MEQLDLNIEGLLRELNDPSSKYPKCLILNKIGEALLNREESQKAEGVLLELLGSEEPAHRFIAFCWLSDVGSQVGSQDPRTISKLEKFKRDPGNKEILLRANQSIEKRRRMR